MKFSKNNFLIFFVVEIRLEDPGIDGQAGSFKLVVRAQRTGNLGHCSGRISLLGKVGGTVPFLSLGPSGKTELLEFDFFRKQDSNVCNNHVFSIKRIFVHDFFVQKHLP